MPQLPTVTIAIPTCNRLRYLPQAIQSALAQTYSHLQVVVSDNASNDGTADFLRSIRDGRFLFVRQENKLGMANNWNACLQHTTGDFFLLLSDDDYLEGTAIEKLLRAVLDADQPDKVGFAYCRTYEVDANGGKQRIGLTPSACENAEEFGLQYFCGKRKIHPACTLFRTADLRKIGGYLQGSVTLAVDAIVWSRILLERGFVVGVSEPLANYRVHSANLTRTLRVEVWQNDIRSLIELWWEMFQNSPIGTRRKFQHAARQYESWVIAAIINQSAATFPERLRLLRTYYRCRKSFPGLIGKANLLGGLAKLLVPEPVKRPIRRILLLAAEPRIKGL